MTENLQIYKCPVCGNLVQVILSGVGELVCCGEPMKLQIMQKEHSFSGEKHNPIFTNKKGKTFVEVLTHPMLEEHYIQFIEVYNKDKTELYLKYFNPGDVAEVDISNWKDDLSALESCNIHGIWGNDND